MLFWIRTKLKSQKVWTKHHRCESAPRQYQSAESFKVPQTTVQNNDPKLYPTKRGGLIENHGLFPFLIVWIYEAAALRIARRTSHFSGSNDITVARKLTR